MTASFSRVRLAAFSLALAVSLSCDKGGGENTKTPAGDDSSPHHPAHKHGEVANDSFVADLHAQPAPNTEGLLRSTHAKSSFDVNAPATVLITTRWGHGSGVVIDPKGLVITNYHVVEAGETEDFGIEVGVTTAKINPDGSADPDKKLRARALKVDPARDLALLQIDGLKGTLPSAPLAPAERPRAGRKVSAIGNAGVGFGWAVKHCHINAIGTLESAASAIFRKEAEALPPEKREEMAKAIAKAAKKAGLQIQTDCTVLPGDSGGPLIDEETHEIVGLNAAIRTSTSGAKSLGSVSFHIHIKEIHDFLADAPKAPTSFVPDPWEVGGHQAAIDDTNNDGEIDSMRVGGHCGSEHMSCHGIFIDMDQDSFRNVAKLPELQEIYDKHSFDAEWVIFQRARLPRGGEVGDHLGPLLDVLIYFDANNDGTFDGLVVRDGEAQANRGYRLVKNGVQRDPSLDDIDTNPQRVFEKAADKENFLHFKAAFEEGTTAIQAERSVPVEVTLSDHTADGKPDTVRIQTRLDERLGIDVDQDALPKLEGKALEKALAAGEIDFELMAVTTSPYRLWYDRDNDGRLDFVLEGSTPERGFALGASTIDAEGKLVPAPGHVGRRLLRPGVYTDTPTREAMEKLLTAAFPEEHATVDDGISSFPSLRVGPLFESRPYPGTDRAAVAVVDGGRAMVFVDLDKDSFKGKDADKLVMHAIRDGTFDAEFVFMFDGAQSWSYYDANNDGKFEEIWVGVAPAAHQPRHKYKIGETVTREDPPAKVTMFEPSVFKKGRLRKTFKQLRSEIVDF
jgi:S1-C subfamily serine protease